MKYIAFYLPQYHAIPENDEWWGDGFTEWVNVRGARPLFRGHLQPEVPLNRDYYDLTDRAVMERQAILARQYGIDAFCYYHYWFEGKLLLEGPLEAMLENPKVEMPFMLCWANESWARTWDGADTDVLIRQNYDESVEGLRRHFQYLLRYFADSRYIMRDGKPVLIVYKPHLVRNIDLMMRKWDEWAVEAGFAGLCWGFQHASAYDCLESLPSFDFGIEFEPLYTVRTAGIKPKLVDRVLRKCRLRPTILDYDQTWMLIERRVPDQSRVAMAPGAFTAWDNTPRKGRRGMVFYESTPEKFATHLRARVENAVANYAVDYLFFNAWNEWGEGAHLEPDEHNGLGYLESVKQVREETAL